MVDKGPKVGHRKIEDISLCFPITSHSYCNYSNVTNLQYTMTNDKTRLPEYWCHKGWMTCTDLKLVLTFSNSQVSQFPKSGSQGD